MHILPLLLCASSSLLLLTASTNADDLRFNMSAHCPDNMSYTSDSAFQANLDAVLSSLPAAAATSSSGFAEKNTSGAAPDQVYGLAQCRGDISPEDCQACLSRSAHEMASKCSGSKDAVLIYEGCLLRYSNASFFGEADTSIPLYMCDDLDNATQPQFSSSLDGLMFGLAEKASVSPRLFAAGKVNLTLYEKIYGMVQCTRDLGPDDCYRCLANAVTKIRAFKDCNGKQAGRIFNWSCSIRFEVAVAPFYNAQAAEKAMSTDPSRSSNKMQLWVIVLSVASAFLLAALVAALLWGIMHRQRRGTISEDIPMHIPLPVARKFTFEELSAATNNFSDDRKLGQGAFGVVYRGELMDPLMPSTVPVAVKRLNRLKEETDRKRTRKDYVTEITTLGRLSHRNLVRLVGWCHGGGDDKQQLLLVYELVTNGSLHEHLHGSQRLLTWPERYIIVRGLGSAIEYLHNSYKNPILHRDIKPSNVMLDDDFEAKLGDFGLVRQVKSGQGSSLKDTVMIGTRVYMDPECMRTDTVSPASDVYSFGVLLLEIATGLEPAEVQGPGALLSNTLINAVHQSYAKGEVLQMADERLNGDFDESQMERVLVVGLLCVQQQREHRPKIRHAVNLLSDLSHPVPQFLS